MFFGLVVELCLHLADPNSDIPVWVQEQKDILDKSELKRLKQQTILYRTSNGRRRRVTPFYLETWGAVIDSSSDEEEEAVRKDRYGHLKYAQAFLAAKLRSS